MKKPNHEFLIMTIIGGVVLYCGMILNLYARDNDNDKDNNRQKQEQQAKDRHNQQKQEPQAQENNQRQQERQIEGEHKQQQQEHQVEGEREHLQQEHQAVYDREHRQQEQQVNREQEQQNREADMREVWQQRRASNWRNEHRTWRQRGGYNGYRIPRDRFRMAFGRNHGFRIFSLSFNMFGGSPRFQYGNYWFSPIDPWPEYWEDNWYQNDDVYIDYSWDGYYLYNRRHPRDRIAITVYER